MKLKEFLKYILYKPNQKKAEVATLILDKVDFKTRIKEEHFITVKGTTKQEDTAFWNLCTINTASKYIKQSWQN